MVGKFNFANLVILMGGWRELMSTGMGLGLCGCGEIDEYRDGTWTLRMW